MTETYCNFKAVCKRHLDYICLNSSCHGANWAMKIESTKLKVFLQVFAIVLQFCMFGAFIQAMSLYISYSESNFYGTKIEIWAGFGPVDNTE